MYANALLVLWSGGWLEVVDPGFNPATDRRAEQLVNYGHILDAGEAERVAYAELAAMAAATTEVDVSMDPPDEARTPWLAYLPGDTVVLDGDVIQVVGVSAVLDGETGRWIFTPQFGALVDSEDQLIDRALKRMVDGTARGASKAASPISDLLFLQDDTAALGSGRPYATFVVAASDTQAADAQSADYVCDGVADDVEIAAAIGANSGIAGGVRVLLLDGTYHFSAAVVVPDSCTLEGQGAGTILTRDGAGTILSCTGTAWAHIRNLRFGNCTNAIVVNGAGDILIEGCYFDEDGSNDILGDAITTTNCQFVNVVDCSFTNTVGFGIRFGNFTTLSRVAGCIFDGAGTGGALTHANRGAIAMIGAGCVLNTIDDNIFISSGDHSIYCDGGSFSTISGNVFTGVGDYSGAGMEFEVECVGGANFNIVGNTFQADLGDEGVYLGANVTKTDVEANNFEDYVTGIRVAGGDDCSIQNNLLSGCTVAVDVDAGSTRTLIDGNTFRLNVANITDAGTTTSTGAGNWIDGVWTGMTAAAGGSSAFIVAASTAPATIKARADYVCDGTADEVEINAALAAAGTAGKVVLTGGAFNLAATVTISSSTAKHIEGVGTLRVFGTTGPRTRLLKSASGAYALITVNSSQPAHLKDLAVVDAGSFATTAACISAATSSILHLEGCEVDQERDGFVAIDHAGTTLVADDCVLIGYDAAVRSTSSALKIHLSRCIVFQWDSTGYAVDVQHASNASVHRITDCYVEGAGCVKILGGSSCELFVTGGEFYPSWPIHGIHFTGGNLVVGDTRIRGFDDLVGIHALNARVHIANVFIRDALAGGVILEDCTGGSLQVDVTGCATSGHGIKLDGTSGVLVDGCRVHSVDRHGIWLLDSSNNSVVNCHVSNYSQETDDTYSGIILDGDCNENTVQVNRCRHGGGAAQGLYGIRVDDATCDDNFVTNNDLKGSSKTGGNELSDAGTGTVTAAGNRT